MTKARVCSTRANVMESPLGMEPPMLWAGVLSGDSTAQDAAPIAAAILITGQVFYSET